MHIVCLLVLVIMYILCLLVLFILILGNVCLGVRVSVSVPSVSDFLGYGRSHTLKWVGASWSEAVSVYVFRGPDIPRVKSQVKFQLAPNLSKLG